MAQKVVGVALACLALAAPAASAASNPGATAQYVDRAVQAASQPAAITTNPATVIPTAAKSGVAIRTDAGKAVTLSLPAIGNAKQQGATSVYDGKAADTKIAVQNTEEGIRALVEITGPSAPERYPFQLGGDVAQLSPQADGSVAVHDETGARIGTVIVPWARDANGRNVPTHFEVEGRTLVQIIEHKHAGFAYPIVADPGFWGSLWHGVKSVAGAVWDCAKCAAALGLALAPAAKIPKAAKAIKDLGGVKATAELMSKAGTKMDFKRWGKKIGKEAAKEILGIAGVEKYCFGK